MRGALSHADRDGRLAGLTSLTQSAIQGMRQMPPHGGNAALTDTEIERAITYMVANREGTRSSPSVERAPLPSAPGEQIVEERYAKCHHKGEGGAPRIGDMAAWIPRLSPS